SRRRFGIGLFALLAFVSPTTIVVAPAIFTTAARTGRRARPYVVALLSAVCFQVVVHFAAFSGHARPPPDLAAAPHVFLSKFVVWPLFGHEAADAYGAWVRFLSPFWFGLTAVLVVIAAVAAARFAAR